MSKYQPKFIYHGTIHGRLKGNYNEGLIPAKKRVWKEALVPGEYLESAVFFTKTIKSAKLWAETTHYQSRGPRKSLHRTPVVIRVPASKLKLLDDVLANSPNCIMVKGIVPVKSADVAVIKMDSSQSSLEEEIKLLEGGVIEDQESPDWQPITKFL
jgi:hypothetical protein